VDDLPAPLPAVGTARSLDDVHRVAGWLVIAGGGLAVLGSVLPWRVATTFGSVFSTDGLRGDGRLTLALGVLLVVIGAITVVGHVTRVAAVVAVVAGAAVIAVAGYNAFDLDEIGRAGDRLASMQLGHGLLITVIGGVLCLIGAARTVARA
jgi:hypothetical protein